jgi:hypothetical protein
VTTANAEGCRERENSLNVMTSYLFELMYVVAGPVFGCVLPLYFAFGLERFWKTRDRTNQWHLLWSIPWQLGWACGVIELAIEFSGAARTGHGFWAVADYACFYGAYILLYLAGISLGIRYMIDKRKSRESVP